MQTLTRSKVLSHAAGVTDTKDVMENVGGKEIVNILKFIIHIMNSINCNVQFYLDSLSFIHFHFGLLATQALMLGRLPTRFLRSVSNVPIGKSGRAV